MATDGAHNTTDAGVCVRDDIRTTSLADCAAVRGLPSVSAWVHCDYRDADDGAAFLAWPAVCPPYLGVEEQGVLLVPDVHPATCAEAAAGAVRPNAWPCTVCVLKRPGTDAAAYTVVARPYAIQPTCPTAAQAHDDVASSRVAEAAAAAAETAWQALRLQQREERGVAWRTAMGCVLQCLGGAGDGAKQPDTWRWKACAAAGVPGEWPAITTSAECQWQCVPLSSAADTGAASAAASHSRIVWLPHVLPVRTAADVSSTTAVACWRPVASGDGAAACVSDNVSPRVWHVASVHTPETGACATRVSCARSVCYNHNSVGVQWSRTAHEWAASQTHVLRGWLHEHMRSVHPAGRAGIPPLLSLDDEYVLPHPAEAATDEAVCTEAAKTVVRAWLRSVAGDAQRPVCCAGLQRNAFRTAWLTQLEYFVTVLTPWMPLWAWMDAGGGVSPTSAHLLVDLCCCVPTATTQNAAAAATDAAAPRGRLVAGAPTATSPADEDDGGVAPDGTVIVDTVWPPDAHGAPVPTPASEEARRVRVVAAAFDPEVWADGGAGVAAGPPPPPPPSTGSTNSTSFILSHQRAARTLAAGRQIIPAWPAATALENAWTLSHLTPRAARVREPRVRLPARWCAASSPLRPPPALSVGTADTISARSTVPASPLEHAVSNFTLGGFTAGQVRRAVHALPLDLACACCVGTTVGTGPQQCRVRHAASTVAAGPVYKAVQAATAGGDAAARAGCFVQRHMHAWPAAFRSLRDACLTSGDEALALAPSSVATSSATNAGATTLLQFTPPPPSSLFTLSLDDATVLDQYKKWQQRGGWARVVAALQPWLLPSAAVLRGDGSRSSSGGNTRGVRTPAGRLTARALMDGALDNDTTPPTTTSSSGGPQPAVPHYVLVDFAERRWSWSVMWQTERESVALAVATAAAANRVAAVVAAAARGDAAAAAGGEPASVAPPPCLSKPVWWVNKIWHVEYDELRLVSAPHALAGAHAAALTVRDAVGAKPRALIPYGTPTSPDGTQVAVAWAGTEWVAVPWEVWTATHALADAEDAAVRVPHVIIWHNPPTPPAWFDAQHAPARLLVRRCFAASYPHCAGILVFSTYLADWLAAALAAAYPTVPVPPIIPLLHPVEAPIVRFSMARFRANAYKCAIQVGYWLRCMCYIAALPLEAAGVYAKVWLYGGNWAFDCRRREAAAHAADGTHGAVGTPCPDFSNVLVTRLSDEAYDRALAENIVVLYLYDASVNNAVIECIVRGTPVIVNAHPAIVELLGPDYPLYADTPAAAAALLHDFDALERGHQHLLALALDDALSHGAFLRSFHAAMTHIALHDMTQPPRCSSSSGSSVAAVPNTTTPIPVRDAVLPLPEPAALPWQFTQEQHPDVGQVDTAARMLQPRRAPPPV